MRNAPFLLLEDIPLHRTGDAKVGNKALSLAKLKQAGFSVPNGIIVSAQVSDQEINSHITSISQYLSGSLFAVRSSSNVEDSSNHTWAGQFATFLNVKPHQLAEKIIACRQSAHSSQVIHYGQHTQSNSSLEIAVIVQEMVASEKSGVAFSLHPVTANKNQIVIEAVFGLGEGLVSGTITPDTYVIDKYSKEILEADIASKEKALYFTKVKGNYWHNLTQKQSVKPALVIDEIRQLTEVILKIEHQFEYPCDIEWAIADNNLYILQCRPITALK